MTRPAHIDPWSRPYIWFGRLGRIPTWTLPLVLPVGAVAAAAVGLVGSWIGHPALHRVQAIALLGLLPLGGLAALYLPLCLILKWVAPRDGRYSLAGRITVGAIGATLISAVGEAGRTWLQRERVASRVEERIATAARAGEDVIQDASLGRADCGTLNADRGADDSWTAVVHLFGPLLDSETLHLNLDRDGQVTSRRTTYVD